MKKKLLIYGTGKLSQIMYHLIISEGIYDICAFLLDEDYITSGTFLNTKVIDIKNVNTIFSSGTHDMLLLIGYKNMRKRKYLFDYAKSLGYNLINYISPAAIVFDGLQLGENNIIFGGVYLGNFGKMMDNNIIRPNTYIGHDFNIGSHNFIAPGCNIGGKTTIGDLSFIGIGSTLKDGLTIANETLTGAGSVLLQNTEPCTFYAGNPAKKIKEHKKFGIQV